jgi:hypothetical protein
MGEGREVNVRMLIQPSGSLFNKMTYHPEQHVFVAKQFNLLVVWFKSIEIFAGNSVADQTQQVSNNIFAHKKFKKAGEGVL